MKDEDYNPTSHTLTILGAGGVPRRNPLPARLLPNRP